MNQDQSAPVAVIGAGSFGTAIAWLLSSGGEDVKLWAFLEKEAQAINEQKRNPSFLSHCDLDRVWATNSVAEAIEGCRAVIIATPSFGVMGVAEQMADTLPPDVPVLILSKGLDLSGERPLIDAVAAVIGGKNRLAVLSGPNHAEELSKGAL
ncbi:MAG: NAD(P)-binding domain-containing protein, partial [Eggerthellaceae bacterium]|nr:NAD(P)-binding domain-containing protein [Eggerthellaceae bacterium]